MKGSSHRNGKLSTMKDSNLVSSSRNNWFFTLNNVEECFGTEDPSKIESALEKKLSHYRYACQLERGKDSEHLHLQGVIASDGRVRGKTLMNKLPGIHLEVVKNLQGSYSYCTKEDTRVAGPFIHEYSTKKNDDGDPLTWNDLVDISMTYEEYKRFDGSGYTSKKLRDRKIIYFEVYKEGRSLSDVIKDPSLAVIVADNLQYCKTLEAKYLEEKSKACEDELPFVEYRWGETGTGKTWTALHDPETGKRLDDVYLVKDWAAPFDNYKGESVILLDDLRGRSVDRSFARSGIALADLIKILDNYSGEVHARNVNRYLAVKKFIITSNWPLEDQYVGESPCDRDAFFNRIDKVVLFVGGSRRKKEHSSFIHYPDGSEVKVSLSGREIGDSGFASSLKECVEPLDPNRESKYGIYPDGISLDID